MEKIPTAVSILSKHSVNYGTIEGNSRAIVKGSEAINAMIEFAQLHVQAALQAASENACVLFEKRTKTYSEYNKRFVVNGGDVYTVAKYNILNAYPQENIK